MQFLNNDIDELVRRAAERHDPPVTGADWNAVVHQLEANEKKELFNIAINSRRFLLLFSFLLASLVCNRYLQVSFRAVNKWNAAAHKEEEKVSKTDLIKKQIFIANNSSDIAGQEKENIYSQNVSKPFYKNVNKKSDGNKDASFFAVSLNDKSDGVIQQRHVTYLQEKNKELDVARNLEKMRADNNNRIVFTTTPPNIRTKVKASEFYIGMLAGLEGNTINMKDVKSGWNGGLLFGYAFRSKWSFEAGLLWNKKNYFTEGKYFNTYRLSLPNHSNIIHADGYCQMFEIPFNVRYRFRQTKKGAWFANAGVSSYLMQKEDYDYLYDRYGVQYYGSKYYKQSSQNWLATINISSGYQHEIGRLGRLRIEPYIKIPVSGMGVGKLPITSVGVQTGLIVPIK